uniref:Uncharacterized protein n=1 Tax=Panagrolaimus davidi TaxID=227884 RepID=A0A914QUK9_9BILA
MISFIYSGYCCLTAENIYQFIDIAEFYLVSCFKEYCDQFLSEVEKSAKNIEEMYECADKYSLPLSMDSIKKYIRRNGIEVYCTENFRGYKKPFAEFLSTIYDTRVQIENNGKTISGTFLDNYGILPAFEKQKSSCSIKRRTSNKIRFSKMKFPVQLTASTVSKMVGIDWYLCFDKDGILSFKNYAAVDRSDFLIAEMKSDNEFALTPDEKTSVSAVYID